MQLVANSFGGLVTTGLYLHDCSLRHLAHSVLRPLNSTVKYLWLNGNDITRLDPGLRSLFSTLQHLRIGENPLRCDCSAVWLKLLYDDRREVFRGAPAPSCHSPERLRGRVFNETTADEFLCRTPQLTRVEVTANNTSARLTCAATGDPVPTIYWIQPNGRATRYLQPSRDLENEGTLLVESFNSDSSLSGMYICVANNDAGNVTLTIDVPASTSDLARPAAYFTSTPSTLQSVNAANSESAELASLSSTTVERPSSSELVTSSTSQTFTLSQLVLVVAITHTVTLVFYVVLAALCYWRRCAIVSEMTFYSSSRPSSSELVTSSTSQTFTLSQLVLVVAITHTVTLVFYVVLAALCYWRRCGRTDEFSRRRKHAARRVHHQRSTASSGSTLYTEGTAKLSSSLAQSPSCGSLQREATVFLNGLGAHRDFFFETAAAYRFRDGEYG